MENIIEFNTIADAESKKLIQLTIWLFKHDLDWLKKEVLRLKQNEERSVMLVKDGNAYAIYVNDLTNSMEYRYAKNSM